MICQLKLRPDCSWSSYSESLLLSTSTLLVFAIFRVTAALYVHTARVRHIRSDCCSLSPHCSCSPYSEWLLVSLRPHCSCSSYSEWLLLSTSTLLVFVIFRMTVTLYVHTARVHHIQRDCWYLRPHCLRLLNTRSECCSLCVYTAPAQQNIQIAIRLC